MLINTELMPFQKYVQSILRVLYHEETVKINGTFKDVVTGEIIEGDIFTANLVGRKTLEETYKAYLKWWNHIRYEHEHPRKFISVKIAETETQVETSSQSFNKD